MDPETDRVVSDDRDRVDKFLPSSPIFLFITHIFNYFSFYFFLLIIPIPKLIFFTKHEVNKAFFFVLGKDKKTHTSNIGQVFFFCVGIFGDFARLVVIQKKKN